jgi:hypothetical protein
MVDAWKTGGITNETVKIEFPVAPATVEALRDEHGLAAVGRLTARLMTGRRAADPLGWLLERIAADAQASGLTDEYIDEERAACNAERRG